ncbi:NAD(P)-dependent oxidoreductase [Nocardia sp. CA-290969]|uniref:NAD(P)-dependent oxidoreductase n=1 Tax=Nocardia sp. CA-290969 TaxID=3239986 RepID=UPI003D8C99D8
MDIGLIGLGNMGFPMAARLRETGHRLVVFDARAESIDRAVTLGAVAASSPADVADRVETVLTSLPTPQASLEVATGGEGIIHGARVRRLVELSTIGPHAARQLSAMLADRGIAMLDCPVSGGVAGARHGTLAIMASGPADEFDSTTPLLEALGRPLLVATEPGAGQTMKLINNLMAAATLAATAEVMVMGVKAGLDPTVMIDVLNAGSGATHASRDKFPRAVLPRTFDFGFATGLMTKDVRLYLDEAAKLGTPTQLAETVARQWEATTASEGPDSDFTTIVKPLEAAAGVIVDGRHDRPAQTAF